MKEGYTFEELLSIIARLRGENGCPWDKAQTHGSMKSCLIYETTETIAAINLYEETGDADNLCEELGDLLMQVVLQSQIASEENIFSIDDVITAVSKKMIRRHPHVFGEGYLDENGELVRGWDKIKNLEKKDRDPKVLKAQKQAEKHALIEVQTILFGENTETYE